MSKVYNFDRVKLKGKKASDFGHNDLIKTGKYLIKKGGQNMIFLRYLVL